mmetsp:Transcript_14770/g.51438  ORF Transcript_14770/g.51438 Transcript_14770/m.51438 type:complete len:908 (-) Transcript_14770:855-3578(-)
MAVARRFLTPIQVCVVVACAATAAAAATVASPPARPGARGSRLVAGDVNADTDRELRDLDAPAVVLMTLALRRGDDASLAELHAYFQAVSDPNSPRRGEYLKNAAEVAALVSARPHRQADVRRWLEGAGVPSSHAFLSPWGDTLVVNTTSDVVAKLLGVQLQVDADGVIRLPSNEATQSFVPSHPLVTAHVTRVSVAGRVAQQVSSRSSGPLRASCGNECRKHTRERYMADSTSAPAYPFTFYPPALLVYALALPSSFSASHSAVVDLDFMLVCPEHPWPSVEVPLSPQAMLSGPGSDVFAPCATTSGDLSHPESFDITLVPTTAGSAVKRHLPFRKLSSGVNGCEEVEYAVPQGQSDYVTWRVGECQYRLLDLVLAPDVQYSVELTYNFASGTPPQTATYTATPSGQVLHLQVLQPKLPSVLYDDYGVPDGARVCNLTTRQGVMVLQNPGSGYYADSDLALFYQEAQLPASLVSAVSWQGELQATSAMASFLEAAGLSGPHSVSRDQSNPGGETTLDVEWMSAMAAGALTTVWHGGYFSVGGSSIDPLIDTLLAVQFAEAPPQVISISYGGEEPTQAAINDGNQLFQILGSLGVTVVVSSGDTGSYLSTGDVADSCTQFLPSWPATSPYVLSVGATQKGTIGGHVADVPASIAYGAGITTGGGFSDMNEVPSWQKADVDAYLAHAKLPKLPFSRNGRGYPDVSVYGHSFIIALNGNLQPVDGTSASAPALGGMLSLMNDGLSRLGAPTLGFITPTLYEMAKRRPAGIVDITTGDNKCLGQSAPAACCDDGFEAAPGWDPVTGLGSIRFAEAFAYIATSLLGVPVTDFPPSPSDCTVAKTACMHSCSGGVCSADGVCSTDGTGWQWLWAVAAGAFAGLVVLACVVAGWRKGRAAAAARAANYHALEG